MSTAKGHDAAREFLTKKERPPVTADDILSTAESQALAGNAATFLRREITRQSGRDVRVTLLSMPGDDVIATVEVLGETTYIVDVTGERTIPEPLRFWQPAT